MSKPEILIVDDKPENIFALEQLLKQLDADLFRAVSGAEALALALDHDFCVAIVDIQMPEMDGYELAALLRSNVGTANLPIIFVSAIFSDEYHHRKGYEAGAVDFMSKPVVPEILISKVRIFMDLYRQRKALEDTNVILSKRAEQLEIGSRVSQQITSILNLDDLLKEVCWAIQARFDYFFVGIWLVNHQSDRLVLRAFTCREDQVPDVQLSIPLGEEQSSLSQALQSGEVVQVTDREAPVHSLGARNLKGPRVQLVFPLKVGAQNIGLLDIRNERDDIFDELVLRVLQMLANQTTIAISNATRYEREQNLRSMEEEKALALARLNAEKDKFFSIISHDLRGPFNILLGSTRLLATKIDKLDRQETVEMADEVYLGAKAACSLLDNLLTWSQMQREGGMKCIPESIDINGSAGEIQGILGPSAAQKEIRLENAVAAGLTARADRFMFETILRNLVGNALKFTPRGGSVTIGAVPGGRTAASGFVTVFVRDTGIGISAANSAKLFRIDTKHTTPGTEKEKGTGLGLIICKEMVEQNGGEIWVESEPGRGTTMKFSLPCPG